MQFCFLIFFIFILHFCTKFISHSNQAKWACSVAVVCIEMSKICINTLIHAKTFFYSEKKFQFNKREKHNNNSDMPKSSISCIFVLHVCCLSDEPATFLMPSIICKLWANVAFESSWKRTLHIFQLNYYFSWEQQRTFKHAIIF